LNTERTTKAQSLLDQGKHAHEQGEHTRAVALLSEAINLCPVAAIPSFALRGKSHLALGHLAESVSDLTVAIAYSPRLSEAYEARGKAFELLGEHQSAQRDAESANSMHP
jgi:tetratricopeptide (TPR) repeat protein